MTVPRTGTMSATIDVDLDCMPVEDDPIWDGANGAKPARAGRAVPSMPMAGRHSNYSKQESDGRQYICYKLGDDD